MLDRLRYAPKPLVRRLHDAGMAAADLSRQSVMASWRHSAHRRPSHRQIVTNPDGRADVKRAFGYPERNACKTKWQRPVISPVFAATRVARCGRNDDRFFSGAQRRIAALPRFPKPRHLSAA